MGYIQTNMGKIFFSEYLFSQKYAPMEKLLNKSTAFLELLTREP